MAALQRHDQLQSAVSGRTAVEKSKQLTTTSSMTIKPSGPRVSSRPSPPRLAPRPLLEGPDDDDSDDDDSDDADPDDNDSEDGAGDKDSDGRGSEDDSEDDDSEDDDSEDDDDARSTPSDSRCTLDIGCSSNQWPNAGSESLSLFVSSFLGKITTALCVFVNASTGLFKNNQKFLGPDYESVCSFSLTRTHPLSLDRSSNRSLTNRSLTNSIEGDHGDHQMSGAQKDPSVFDRALDGLGMTAQIRL